MDKDIDEAAFPSTDTDTTATSYPADTDWLSSSAPRGSRMTVKAAQALADSRVLLLAAYAEYCKKPAVCKSDKANTAFGRGGAVYRYASLAALQRASIAKLASHGLTINQLVKSDGNGDVVVTTVLGHSSGQCMESTLRMAPDKQKGVHGFASAATYAQRLGLRALVQIICVDELDPDEEADAVDDDGNAAAGVETPTQQHKSGSALDSALAHCRAKGMPEPMIAAFLQAQADAPEETQLAELRETLKTWLKTSPVTGLTQPRATKKRAKVSNDDALFS